ncbi:TPA: hypothetical protein ACG0BM_001311 [Streptococcus pyogenes]
MKTRSKRFLNLATLCLALLGTTLLTTQPVKASDSVEGSQERLEREENPYEKGKNDGYRDGQRDGKKEESLPEPPQNYTYHNPYSDRLERYSYKQGYEEWYVLGYYKGRHESKKADTSSESQRQQDSSGSQGQQDSSESQGQQDSSESQGQQDLSEVLSAAFDFISEVLGWIYRWIG